MKVRYWFYLAFMILAFVAVGSSDLKVTVIAGLVAIGLFILTEVLSRLADRL